MCDAPTLHFIKVVGLFWCKEGAAFKEFFFLPSGTSETW
jgi:hypothetical protein